MDDEKWKKDVKGSAGVLSGKKPENENSRFGIKPTDGPLLGLNQAMYEAEKSARRNRDKKR